MGASATVSDFRDTLSEIPQTADGRTNAVYPCESSSLPPELTPRAREILEVLNRLFDQAVTPLPPT